jgi:pimeloyl-ACP methyl ester carboxylesterase
MAVMNCVRLALALAAAALLAAAQSALPAVPASKTLTATLTDVPVAVDVYAPEVPAGGAVVLAHGFLRSRANMAGHARALAREGWLVVVPDLPSKVDSRANGQALVELVAQLHAGAFGPPAGRIVLVGFSAGGLSTLLAAASPGVVGYVGLDPFDRPGGVGLAAAKALRTPVVLLYGPPTFCNAYGIARPWGDALPALRENRLVEGHSHCDFEAPTDRWCEFLCGATDPARQQAIRAALVAAVNRLFAEDAARAPGAAKAAPSR